MNKSSDYRSLVLLLMLACVLHMPQKSVCQTLEQKQAPVADEKADAELNLRVVSAVLTKAPDGRVVGFQMAEGHWPGVQAWPYLFKLTDLELSLIHI